MPFQFRAEILFRWRRRNFFSSCHLRAGNKRKSFRRMAGGDAFAFFARRLDKTGGSPCRPPVSAALKRPLRGVFAHFYSHAGFGGFAQPCAADFAPLLPVAAVDGHIVEGRAVAPADRRIHAAVYGLYGRCGGGGVKFRAIALSIPSVSSLENSRGS